MPNKKSNLYAFGRKIAKFKSPWKGKDVAFCWSRVDKHTIDGGDYKHCTFANVSFLRSRITKCQSALNIDPLSASKIDPPEQASWGAALES